MTLTEANHAVFINEWWGPPYYCCPTHATPIAPTSSSPEQRTSYWRCQVGPRNGTPRSREAKDYGRPRSSSSPTSRTGTTRPKRRTWKPDWDRHGPPHPEETPLVVDPFASDLNPALTSGHTTIAALNQRKPASRVRRYFQKSATAIAINTITLSDKTISMSTPR